MNNPEILKARKAAPFESSAITLWLNNRNTISYFYSMYDPPHINKDMEMSKSLSSSFCHKP